MKPWLSDEELRELTGYVRPSRQARWLSDNGIKFYLNALNKVRVPRASFSGTDSSQREARTEPDFSKVRRAARPSAAKKNRTHVDAKRLSLAVRLATRRKQLIEKRQREKGAPDASGQLGHDKKI